MGIWSTICVRSIGFTRLLGDVTANAVFDCASQDGTEPQSIFNARE